MIIKSNSSCKKVCVAPKVPLRESAGKEMTVMVG